MSTSCSQQEAVYPASPPFKAVAIAASLGGLTALSEVLANLPADFPVPIIVVQHLHPDYKSELAEIWSRRTSLIVQWAKEGDHLCASHVYIAPPDYHVLVKSPGIITLSGSPKVQFVRPSANPLFESVAACYGERAIAVVLTGTGSDGANGVQAIKYCGGKVLVQNRHTSRAFNMPSAALKTGCVDFTLSLRIIARALISLVMVEGASQFFSVTSPMRTREMVWHEQVKPTLAVVPSQSLANDSSPPISRKYG